MKQSPRDEMIDITDAIREVRTEADGIRLMSEGLDAVMGAHQHEPISAAAERIHDRLEDIVDRINKLIPEDLRA